MSDSIFDFAASKLEQASGLDKLEARGTLRIALRSAGLEREVANAQEHCRQISGSLRQRFPNETTGANRESPEAIFGRLGRPIDA